MTQEGCNLKQWLMGFSDEDFKPLTFDELKVGQKFIPFPTPGDNDGHGGLREAHNVFTKTENRVASTGCKVDLLYPPHQKMGRATQKRMDGSDCSSDFSHSDWVILLNI